MRHHRLTRIPLVAILFALLAVPCAPVIASEFDSERLAAIRGRMQKFVDEHVLAGAVTVVGNRQGVASLEAVGSLNLESAEPMPANALFRIASMTKPITALGNMILADEGKLSVEDPVEKYLPEFRGQ